jgi:hypothetical protein
VLIADTTPTSASHDRRVTVTSPQSWQPSDHHSRHTRRSANYAPVLGAYTSRTWSAVTTLRAQSSGKSCSRRSCLSSGLCAGDHVRDSCRGRAAFRSQSWDVPASAAPPRLRVDTVSWCVRRPVSRRWAGGPPCLVCCFRVRGGVWGRVWWCGGLANVRARAIPLTRGASLQLTGRADFWYPTGRPAPAPPACCCPAPDGAPAHRGTHQLRPRSIEVHAARRGTSQVYLRPDQQVRELVKSARAWPRAGAGGRRAGSADLPRGNLAPSGAGTAPKTAGCGEQTSSPAFPRPARHHRDRRGCHDPALRRAYSRYMPRARPVRGRP